MSTSCMLQTVQSATQQRTESQTVCTQSTQWCSWASFVKMRHRGNDWDGMLETGARLTRLTCLGQSKVRPRQDEANARQDTAGNETSWGKETPSSAVAERPRNASCLPVGSLVQYIERNLVLLVTSASDLLLRTIKFSSLLFVVVVHAAGCDKQDSLMRRHLCGKLHSGPSQLLLTCQSHRSDSQIYWLRVTIFAYPTCIRRPP